LQHIPPPAPGNISIWTGPVKPVWHNSHRNAIGNSVVGSWPAFDRGSGFITYGDQAVNHLSLNWLWMLKENTVNRC